MCAPSRFSRPHSLPPFTSTAFPCPHLHVPSSLSPLIPSLGVCDNDCVLNIRGGRTQDILVQRDGLRTSTFQRFLKIMLLDGSGNRSTWYLISFWDDWISKEHIQGHTKMSVLKFHVHEYSLYEYERNHDGQLTPFLDHTHCRYEKYAYGR